MVKKLLKFLAFTLFFIFALVAFTPKESFYFLLEQNLKKFDVVISNERVEDNLLSLNIQNMEITTKGVDSALVSEADITLLLFYNSLKFSDVKLSSLVDAYAPSRVESLDVSYTLFNPLVLNAYGVGKFGEVEVAFNILDRELNVLLKPSKVMHKKYKKTMKMMKKDENGEYRYAKNF
ncbi:MAG: hypothetical protein U9N39_07535 [Campylobacterota bacterium]|nr:hypothetical protein [Campylobacterota bacterium]